MTLTEIILLKIQERGPISFCEFMGMALYCPGFGYYTSGKERIGPGGDYFTKPFVSPAFAAMIAWRFEEMWKLLKCKLITIVEFGAGAECFQLLKLSKYSSDVVLHRICNPRSLSLSKCRIVDPMYSFNESVIHGH